MPRLDHRRLESLFFPSDGAPKSLQGTGEAPTARRRNLRLALGFQMVYAAFMLMFAGFEMYTDGLVHKRPPAELLKVMAYSFSCLSVYRSVPMYLRLMVIWTITTAFSGVYQSLVWLENSSGSETEHILVKALLMLSIGGMVGNVMGIVTMFPSGGSLRSRHRRRLPAKES